MKRSVCNLYNQMQERYSGLVTQMNFRFLNLCVKAEEASLLPIKVNIEGEAMDLEDVATMAKKNDYEFVIVPTYTDDLPHVAQGIAMVHPEFKQSIENMKVDSMNIKQEKVERDIPYILLTMPEVDDDRHDFMKEMANTIYEDCKVRMEEEKTKAAAQLVPLLTDDPEADDITRYFDMLAKEWQTKRDNMHEAKIKEIEDAYQEWLSEYAKSEIKQLEYDDAHNHSAAKSLKLTDL